MRKNTRFSIFYLVFSVLSLVFFLVSCKDEFKYTTPEIDPVGDSEVAVVFQMKTPNTKEMGETTRALSINDEKAVKELRVLMFTVDAISDEESFAYEAKVMEIDEIKMQAKVVLRLSSAGELYRAVLVANAGAPSSTTFAAGATKEAVLKQLTFDATGKWNSNSSTDFTPLPMLGESAPAPVHGAAVAKPFAKVNLLRAVARVDVGLCLGETPQFDEQANQGDISGLNGFTLSKVYVYNSNTKGYVGRVGALDSAPSVPDNVSRNGVLAYDVTGGLTLREIYLSEVVNADTTKHMDRPFLVIEGIYKDKTTFYRIDYLKGETNSAGETTYTYLPLLRNHRYKVNITKIGGRGFDTQAEAAKSTAANIAYDVTVWNESSLARVIYDGQYMLGVSEDNLTFYNRKETQQITVRTSWLDGWKAAITSPNSEWLTIDKTTGEANADVSLNITVDNNTAPDATTRNGVITITAGRMSWDVNVIQKNEGIVSIKITGHEEQGDAGQPIIVRNFVDMAETKKIVVEYLPTTEVELKGPEGLKLVDDFKFKKIEEESVPGRAVYSITVNKFPDDDNPFNSISDVAYFTVKADGKTSAASMVLVQTEYNAVPYQDENLQKLIKDEDTFFLLDGKNKEFYIQANTPYEIKVVNYESDAGISLIQSGFELNVPQEKSGKYKGEKLDFTPINNITGTTNPGAYLGFVHFEITSPNNLFEKKSFKIALGSGIIQKEANCYMMRPGHMGVLIPISRINTAHDEYNLNRTDFDSWYNGRPLFRDIYNWDKHYILPTLGGDEEWVPSLVWSDMENEEHKVPVNRDGTAGIRAIKKVQVDSKDYIFVLPGKDESKTGNAVIACRRDSKNDDTILWSWHIWVQPDYPNVINDKWLSRNLGATLTATSADDTNKDTHGVHYQFGRKDPFPPPTSLGYRLLVNSNGEREGIGQYRDDRAMRLAIQYPLRLIRNTENWLKETTLRHTDKWRIWYSSWGGIIYDGGNRSENIAGTKKSVFDPCPYGWKVPAYGVESDWESSGMFFPKSGMYVDGGITDWKSNNTIYGLSSVRSSSHRARYIIYGVNNENYFGRSATRLIRCVKNSGYQDGGEVGVNEYEDYTIYLP